MMKMTWYLLFYFACSGPLYAACDGDWRLYEEYAKDDITVCYRDLDDGSGLIEFRGETIVEAGLSTLVALLHDFDALPSWVAQVKSAEILKQLSDKEYIVYFTLDSPLIGFQDRDSVVRSSVQQDPVTGEVTIYSDVLPGYIDDRSDHVRIRQAASKWILTASGEDRVSVLFQGHANPGGPLERFIITYFMEAFLWMMPYYTLVNMKKYLDENIDLYTEASFDFIDESIQASAE